MVTYNKDMAAATKSSFQPNKLGRSDWDSGSSNSSLKRGKPSTATTYKEHNVTKMGSGGKPGGDKRLSYQCKSPDHLAKACHKSGSG